MMIFRIGAALLASTALLATQAVAAPGHKHSHHPKSASAAASHAPAAKPKATSMQGMPGMAPGAMNSTMSGTKKTPPR